MDPEPQAIFKGRLVLKRCGKTLARQRSGMERDPGLALKVRNSRAQFAFLFFFVLCVCVCALVLFFPFF